MAAVRHMCRTLAGRAVHRPWGSHRSGAYGANPLLSMYNPRYLRRT
jgi:hypothetical protein